MTVPQVLSKIHDPIEGGESDLKLQYAAFRLQPVRCFHRASLPCPPPPPRLVRILSSMLFPQFDELSTLTGRRAQPAAKVTDESSRSTIKGHINIKIQPPSLSSLCCSCLNGLLYITWAFYKKIQLLCLFVFSLLSIGYLI